MYGFNTTLAQVVGKYYRWLSKKYVQTFGRLQPKLADTIFRYNDRDRKGIYIRSLAGTVPSWHR
jgi:hypothetical protein